MSYSQHYGDKTPTEIIELKRARARALYEEKRAQTGGEGVKNPGPGADTDPFTSSEKLVPKEVSASGPTPVLGPGEVPVFPLDLSEVVPLNRAGPIPDAEPAQDQVQALDRIHDLVIQMQGFVTTHTPESADAWAELQRDYGPVIPEPELVNPLPMVGIDDPPEVQKSKVIRKLPGNKWIVRPFKLSKAPEGVLFLRGTQFVKEGWTVWVKPNSFESLGGYQLFGDYNRFGDRLK